MAMKVRTVAVMKRPNIQCDANLAMESALVISVGRATARSVSQATSRMGDQLKGGTYL